MLCDGNKQSSVNITNVIEHLLCARHFPRCFIKIIFHFHFYFHFTDGQTKS